MKRKIVISTIVKDNVDLTKRFLKSLCKYENNDDFYLVIQNNNSSNGAKEYLADLEKEYPNFYLFTNSYNQGFSKCHNFVFNKFYADYYILANNDIELTSSFINKYLQCFDKDKNVYLVSGVQINENGHDYGARMSIDGNGKAVNNIENVNKLDWVSFALCMIKRDCLFDVGLLDEQFEFYYEDVDYCLRMREKGFKFVVDIEVEFKHFHHQSSHFIDKKKMMEESKSKFLEKWKNKLLPLLQS